MTVWHSRRALLVAHVLAGAGLFGADVVLLVLAASGLDAAAPETVYPAAARIGTLVIQPLAALALVSGVALTVVGRRSWSTPWILVKLSVTVVLAGVLVTVLVPRLGAVADTAASHGQVSDADRRALVIAPAISSTLLAVNAALGVVKPRRRTNSSTVPQPS